MRVLASEAIMRAIMALAAFLMAAGNAFALTRAPE